MTIAESESRISRLRKTISGEWTEPKRTKLFAEDIESLGDIPGRHGMTSEQWYRHPAGELVADHGTLRESRGEAPPDGRPYTQTGVAGDRVFQVYTWKAPGTYEQLVNAPPATTQRVAGPRRRVDALSRFDFTLLNKRHGVLVRGDDDILAALASEDVVPVLTPDGTDYDWSAPDGRMMLGLRELVRVADPIVRPRITTGAHGTCQVTAHASPVAAWTVTTSGLLACQPCTKEEFVS